MFSDTELAYVRSQRLARLATATPDGQPDAVPVVFEFDGSSFFVAGLDLERTIKYRNVVRNPKVSLVLDDLASVDPWVPRGLKIHGAADVVTRTIQRRDRPCLRIRPTVKWTWGLDEPAIVDGKPNIKRVDLRPGALAGRGRG